MSATEFESHWGRIQWQDQWFIWPCLVYDIGLPWAAPIQWTDINKAVSTLTDTRHKDKIVNIVFEVSWWTQTMKRCLEIICNVGLFYRAWLFFSVHISADSCTLNLLYDISKLLRKIDQVS